MNVKRLFLTKIRLLFVSNWNRFLSTNQEEMAKSMQFAFNDWKLQGFEGKGTPRNAADTSLSFLRWN